MEFRTTIKTAEQPGFLRHEHSVMLVGSCFSDNIGQKMRGAMMRALVNPMGTIYNPLSIATSVERLVAGTPVAGMDLFQHSGVWNSFLFHSRFSLADKQATLDHMNSRIALAHETLRACDVLVVTLGTAVVYRLHSTGEVVNNCHKVPQHEFERSMTSVATMTTALDGMVRRLLDYNPKLRIIFTVSPIRHLADGLDVNSLSKASLRVAVNEVVSRHREACVYFPAYEIMVDDLRDYRFYAADMIHPTEVAVEYIWQTFQATYFDDKGAQAVSRCERVSKRLQHRPMSANRDVVARFAADTAAVLRNLVHEYPYLVNNPEVKNLLED